MSLQPVVAVTLGSNGFHLIEVCETDGRLETTRHLYENVQAESWLGEDMRLGEEGIDAIISAVERFGDYLRANPGSLVGAIATGTFRRALNAQSVLEQAGNILGARVQVLSGRDESLLCYIGIASSAGLVDHNRLVIDVGGGSTEIMVAKQSRLLEYASIDIGCVSLTRIAFHDDVMNESHFDQARTAAREAFSPVVRKFQDHGWDEVMGCGGTVSSLFTVLQAKRMGGRFITPAGLERFRNAVNESGSSSTLCAGVVPDERSKLLPAGSVVLDAIFMELGVEKLAPVFSSVAHGLLVELMKHPSRQ